MNISSDHPGTACAPAQTGTTGLIGYWYRTWSHCATLPAGTNLGIAFSGLLDPLGALQDGARVHPLLPSPGYLCLGGGSSKWTCDAIAAVTSAIGNGAFKGYQGIAYDIEEGSRGLSAPFLASFSAARAAGLAVLVTVSHSAPFGIPDGATLMQALFESADIDILSPQLYTTGEESANDYATSHGITWCDYAKARATVAPSIVDAAMYADAQTQFGYCGVTLGGFIQWRET
jgi:hypothetical protein